MSGRKKLIFDFDSPVKTSQSLSESQTLPRRSSRAHSNNEEEAAADHGDTVIINGQEEETAAASSYPKSKEEKEKKKRKWGPQSPSSPAASAEKSSNSGSIWSEEDEIKILQGIVAEKQNSSTPKYNSKSIEGFLAVVGPSLSFKATGPQLQSKIRHLKERYAYAPPAKKSEAKGHKKALYDLCDEIWSSLCAVADGEEPRSYPELKIAVERQGGCLRFDEVAAALGEDARKMDEEFKKLRQKEKELWKQIHERL